MPRLPKFVTEPGFVRQADRYCKICDQDFQRPSGFKRHLETTLIHNPLAARRFRCQHCGDLYTQRTSLKIHEASHLDGQSERICGLLVNGGTRVCNFSCSQPSAMVRHMNRAHPKAIGQTGKRLPAWIEDEKVKIRQATRAKKAERQLLEAGKSGLKYQAATTRHLVRKSRSPSPFTVQVFYLDTMEPVFAEPASTEDQPTGKASEMDLFNFNNDAVSTTTSSEEPMMCEAGNILSNDCHPFSQLPSSFDFDFSTPNSQIPTNSNFGSLSFDDLPSFDRHSSTGIDMFADATSHPFPQLLDDQFLCGSNPFPNDYRTHLTDNPTGPFHLAGQQAEMNLHDYWRFASAEDAFGAFFDGL